jgi:hypothetical protein
MPNIRTRGGSQTVNLRSNIAGLSGLEMRAEALPASNCAVSEMRSTTAKHSIDIRWPGQVVMIADIQYQHGTSQIDNPNVPQTNRVIGEAREW